MLPPPPPPVDPERLEENNLNFGYEEISFFAVCMNVLTTITHFALGAAAFSAFLFVNFIGGTHHLSQHIILCTTGYIILMSQAVLTFNPYNGWASGLKYPKKKFGHLVMQVVGSTLAITGSVIRFYNMRVNLVTIHGIFGLIAMILTVVSLIAGFMNLICPKKFSTLLHRTLHALIGSATLLFAFVCLCFGFNDVYRDVLGDENADLSIAMTAVALVGTLTNAFVNVVKRIKGRSDA
ncbi:hypothetical protein K1T71_010285 [Dendrolimus kikuchii]|uniref:Uncharacterized protein n=1 Tax=Dendrolimus kikuchii TaxID=765133 RepID=A0ACC1CR58_9NEOP|nr:hypothetical protein K1T71_010285 [Dendrolimus kikuchii]